MAMSREARDSITAFLPLLSVLIGLIVTSLVICTRIAEAEAEAGAACLHAGIEPSCHISERAHCSCHVAHGLTQCEWRCELSRP